MSDHWESPGFSRGEEVNRRVGTGVGGGVLLVGEILVDFLGEGGQSLEEARAFRPQPGGAPANAAVAAARAGARTAFLGCVGADAFGRLLRTTLERAGVDAVRLREHPRLPTTLAFVMPAVRGDFGFQFNRGADAALSVEDLTADAFSEVTAFGCGGVSLSAPGAREATLAALEAASARGAWTLFDVNWRPALWDGVDTALPVLRAAIRRSRAIKCNETELALVAGTDGDPAARARRLLADGPQAVVVTLGERGSLWVTADAQVHHPGFQADSVDAIGAGDCFSGNLLARWAERGAADAPAPAEMARILEWCNAAAALSTLRPGAMGAMPSAAEVSAFLAGRDS